MLPSSEWRRKSQHTPSPAAKLRDVLATLSDLNLSLYDLLAEAKKVSEASTEGESQWQSLLGNLATDDRDRLQSYFRGQRQVVPIPLKADCNGDSSWEVKAKQILRDEVQAVGRSQIFGRWTKQAPTNFFAAHLPQAIGVIGERAPHLLEILRVITLPVRNAPLEAKQGSLVSP